MRDGLAGATKENMHADRKAVFPAIPRRPRLLLISYHFPPDPAIGSLRWQKLARFAAERGWGLDVVARDRAELPVPDLERLEEIPPDTRIRGVLTVPLPVERAVNAAWSLYRRVRPVRVPAPSPPGAANGGPAGPERRPLAPSTFRRDEVRYVSSARDAARLYFAWLDFARGNQWAVEAARLGCALVEPGVHRAVISCGPPHSAHDAAVIVSRRAGLPLVVDMRDPWSLVQRIPEHFASPLWFRLAERHERRAVDGAGLIVTNTELARDAMCAAHADASSRILAVPNGFDDDPLPASRPRRQFVIAYAGTIYLDRDPRPLFRAAARVIRDLGLSPDAFTIELMGDVSSHDGVPLEQLAREAGVEEYVRLRLPGSRREALEFLATATLLVLLPQDSDLAIPGKLFEYMRFDAWLMVLSTRESATGALLRGSSVDVVAPDDIDAMAELMLQRYRQHVEGVRPVAVASDDRFSRRVQADRLFTAIEALAGSPVPPFVPPD